MVITRGYRAKTLGKRKRKSFFPLASIMGSQGLDLPCWKAGCWLESEIPPKAFLITPQIQLHPSAFSSVTGSGSMYVKPFRGVNRIKTVV